jgi:glycine/D-amino acid oxidase-like deaminating enzyme
MKTRYGRSPWIHEFPDTRRPTYPRLRGSQVADVVIVGGGLTGCATAYACAVAGLRAVVVEADRIGQSATGRSSGLLLPDPGPSFKAIAALHGLRAARQIFEAWRRSALDAAALIRRLGTKAGLDRADVLTIANDATEAALRRDAEARAAAGVDARWLKARQARDAARLDAAGALRLSDAAIVDPYRVCLGLASAAIKRGAVFAEKTTMVNTRVSRKDVDVIVDGGSVRAQMVIVATGLPDAAFKPLRRHFTRCHTYFAMTEPVPASIRKQIPGASLVIRDAGSPSHRVRWTRDGRLIVGGADQGEVPARTRDATLVQRTGQLMYELLTMYPVISGLMPAYGWDAAYGETADGLMYIGAHRNYPRHLFALGGRDSLTGSFLAARMLARAAAGEPAKADDLFGWTR